MIQSAATKYAIRAVCHLAQLSEGSLAQAREISSSLGIPRYFLSKVLQDLSRKGILSSTKGPGGGFRLNCSPTETSLYSLVEAVEGPISDEECLLGLALCSDETACPMHDAWKGCRTRFREKMKEISLQDVVEAERRKRERGGDPLVAARALDP